MDPLLQSVVAGIVGDLAAAIVGAFVTLEVTGRHIEHERKEAGAQCAFKLLKIRKEREQSRLADAYIEALNVGHMMLVQARAGGTDATMKSRSAATK